MPTPDLHDALGRLPFPLALPVARSLAPELSVEARTRNAIFAAYQAMRLLALLLLADYLDREDTHAPLTRHLARMRKPTFADWFALTGALCKWARGSTSSCRLGPLAEAWATMRGDRGGLEGLCTDPNADPLTAIWHARNSKVAHSGLSLEGLDSGAELVEQLVGALARMLGHLEVLEEVELVREVPAAVSGGARAVFVLRGDSETGRFPMKASPDPALLSALDSTGIALQFRGHTLPLEPLFILGDDEFGTTGGLTEPVLMFHGYTPTAVVQLGVFRNVEDPAGLAPLRAALESKGAQLALSRDRAAPWSVADWANQATAAIASDAVQTRYWPDCYVDREADSALRRAVERAPAACLVVGAAGTGKSSLLLHLVTELLRTVSVDRGDIVVLIEGSALQGDDANAGLLRALGRGLGVGAAGFENAAALLHHILSQARHDSTCPDRRLWFVIDALDEAEGPLAVARELESIRAVLAKEERLVILATARTWLVRSREAEAPTEGRPPPFAGWSTFSPSGQGDPWLTLLPFDEEASGTAYTARSKALPFRSCLTPWEELSPALHQALRHPLHIQLFHESYAGRKGLGGGDLAGLLTARIDRAAEDHPELLASIEQIGGWLDGHGIPQIEAGWAEETLGGAGVAGADPVAILLQRSPLELLVDHGILTPCLMEAGDEPPRTRAYRFTHPRLAEHVLQRWMEGQAAEDPRFVMRAAKRARPGGDDSALRRAALGGLLSALAGRGEGGALRDLLGQRWTTHRMGPMSFVESGRTIGWGTTLLIALLMRTPLAWFFEERGPNEELLESSWWRALLSHTLRALAPRLQEGLGGPLARSLTEAVRSRPRHAQRLLIASREASAALTALPLLGLVVHEAEAAIWRVSAAWIPAEATPVGSRQHLQRAVAVLEWAEDAATACLDQLPRWRFLRRRALRAELRDTALLRGAQSGSTAGRAHEVLEQAATTVDSALVYAEVQAGWLARERGDGDEALALVERAVAHAGELGEKGQLERGWAHTIRGLVLLDHGQGADGAATLLAAVDAISGVVAANVAPSRRDESVVDTWTHFFGRELAAAVQASRVPRALYPELKARTVELMDWRLRRARVELEQSLARLEAELDAQPPSERDPERVRIRGEMHAGITRLDAMGIEGPERPADGEDA